MNTSKRTYLILGVLGVAILVVLGWLLWPENNHYDLRAHYTKYEYRIPMRDGVPLYAAVYVPNDTSQSYPILITRTPFGSAPYGPGNFPPRLGPADAFDRAGYIF